MSMLFELRSAYLNEGYSRRSFARKIDVPEQSLRRLENGQGVRPETAKKVADHFGIKVTDLMPFEEAAA